MKIKKENLSEKICSFLVALILLTPAYLVFFDTVFGINRGLILRLIIIVFLIMFGVLFLLNKKIKFNKAIFLILISGLLLYIFSISNNNKANYTFVQFGFYFILPAVLMSQKIMYEKFFEYTIYQSLLFIVGLDQMLKLTNVGLNQGNMYNIYSFLPTILSALTHFLFYRNNTKLIIKIGYLLNIIYLLRVSLVAVRGFWLVIIVYVALTVLYFMKKHSVKKIYYLFLGIGSIVLIIALFFWKEILNILLPALQQFFSVEIGILIKMQKLLESGDVSNGRIEIWNKSLEYFFESPIYGNGMESMTVLSDGHLDYPHNYIIQLLLDGGIFFGTIPIYCSIKGIINLVLGKFENIREYQFAIFLVANSIPIAMLSGDMWKSAALWLTIFFFAKKIKKNE